MLIVEFMGRTENYYFWVVQLFVAGEFGQAILAGRQTLTLAFSKLLIRLILFLSLLISLSFNMMVSLVLKLSLLDFYPK